MKRGQIAFQDVDLEDGGDEAAQEKLDRQMRYLLRSFGNAGKKQRYVEEELDPGSRLGRAFDWRTKSRRPTSPCGEGDKRKQS